MCCSKKNLPAHILRILYNSLIFPHLQYSILAWGFKMDRLEKWQKRTVRIISCSKYNSHTGPLFKNLNLLKLNDFFELNVLKLYYKHRKNILPFYISNIFSYCSVGHSYNLRAEYILKEHGSNRPSGDKCIRHYLLSVMNKSKPDILDKISTHIIQGFAFYIKRITTCNYKVECIVCNCCIRNDRS